MSQPMANIGSEEVRGIIARAAATDSGRRYKISVLCITTIKHSHRRNMARKVNASRMAAQTVLGRAVE